MLLREAFPNLLTINLRVPFSHFSPPVTRYAHKRVLAKWKFRESRDPARVGRGRSRPTG